MSHNCVHSDTVPLHLILSLTLNLKNSQGYTWSSASPFLLPTAVWLLSCSDSKYWVFWLVVFAPLVMPSAAVACSLPLSSGTYKKGNLVPNHIFLVIYPWFFFFKWGSRACDTGCVLWFTHSFIFIA